MKLYFSPGTCALASHIVLAWIGKPYTIHKVSKEQRKEPWFLEINPAGAVPVIEEDDGWILTQNSAILNYLADKHPEASLAPPLRTAERAHCYKWLMWGTNTLQAMLMHYFYPERMVDEGDADAAMQVNRRAEARVGLMLDLLDAQVASHGGEWMLASGHSVVDPFMFMLCRWTRGFARPARSRAHLGPYLQRILERPAVQRMLAAENIARPYV